VGCNINKLLCYVTRQTVCHQDKLKRVGCSVTGLPLVVALLTTARIRSTFVRDFVKRNKNTTAVQSVMVSLPYLKHSTGKCLVTLLAYIRSFTRVARENAIILSAWIPVFSPAHTFLKDISLLTLL